MAKGKKSESMLPTDTTPSLGSNYGLDGFEFYDEMNEGVLDGARLPETRGLSALPGNLVGPIIPDIIGSGGEKRSMIPKKTDRLKETGGKRSRKVLKWVIRTNA